MNFSESNNVLSKFQRFDWLIQIENWFLKKKIMVTYWKYWYYSGIYISYLCFLEENTTNKQIKKHRQLHFNFEEVIDVERKGKGGMADDDSVWESWFTLILVVDNKWSLW